MTSGKPTCLARPRNVFKVGLHGTFVSADSAFHEVTIKTRTGNITFDDTCVDDYSPVLDVRSELHAGDPVKILWSTYIKGVRGSDLPQADDIMRPGVQFVYDSD